MNYRNLILSQTIHFGWKLGFLKLTLTLTYIDRLFTFLLYPFADDSTRVILKDCITSDYVNASFVNVRFFYLILRFDYLIVIFSNLLM